MMILLMMISDDDDTVPENRTDYEITAKYTPQPDRL
jgi:hypothetical protein